MWRPAAGWEGLKNLKKTVQLSFQSRRLKGAFSLRSLKLKPEGTKFETNSFKISVAFRKRWVRPESSRSHSQIGPPLSKLIYGRQHGFNNNEWGQRWWWWWFRNLLVSGSNPSRANPFIMCASNSKLFGISTQNSAASCSNDTTMGIKYKKPST